MEIYSEIGRFSLTKFIGCGRIVSWYLTALASGIGEKMNIYLRFLAAALAILMLLASFVGCNVTPDEKETNSPDESNEEETVDEYMPDIEKKNYGKEFYLSIMGDVNPVEYYWVEESSNDTMSDALYNRQEKIRSHIGVEIFGTRTAEVKGYITPFQTAVKNKDDSVHFLISHVFYGIDGFITGNYIRDFNDVEEIDLDADYWNIDVMDQISVAGKRFLGFSDFNILYTHVLSFNKGMLEKYEDQLDESLYEMVDNYHWTLDKMIWLASLAYVDTNSDGKTNDDIFGLVGYQSVPFIGFMHASNINVVEQDEKGNYVISLYNDKNKQKMSDLVDKLYDVTRADYANLLDGYFYNGMVTDTALMEISSTYKLPGYLAYDVEFGVVPFPMYDEMQKDVGYRSLQWGGYLCIPSYTADPVMVGETVELLAYYSDEVNTAFYEKLLGKKVANEPNDRRMLDIVWDSVCSDFGQTYFSVIENTNFVYILPEVTRLNTTQNLASYVARYESSANKNLKKFIAAVGK